MGYSQWVQIVLSNRSHATNLQIKDLYLHWGKFYSYPDTKNEVGADTIADQAIGKRKAFSFAACGRENSPSGTEGNFDVYAGNERVCQIYWNCPYSGDNNLSVRYVNSGWFINTPSWSSTGALGTVTISFVEDKD